MAQRWPLEPLFDLVRNPDGSRCSQSELAERIGVPQQTISKWNQRGGVPDYIADTIAVRVKLHPWVVWGDAWMEYGLTIPDEPLCVHGHPKPADARHCRVCDRERKRTVAA